MADSGEVAISSIEFEGIQMERRALISRSDTSPQQSVPDDSYNGSSSSNLSQDSESEFFKYSYDIEKMNDLLKDGADPNRRSELGRTALHWAAGYRLPNQETQDSQLLALQSMLGLLVSDEGLDINARDETGCTPLNLACRSSSYHAVQILLSQDKVMIDEADDDGRTPLHTACMQDNEEIVELLIKNKADLFKVTNNEETPLYLACFCGRDKIVSSLLSSCSDEDRKRMLGVSVGDEGKAPLRIAYEWNHTKVANILLKHGADPNIFKRVSTDDKKGSPYQRQSSVSDIGMTTLQIAAKFGIVNVVKVLLEGIPVDDDAGSRIECAVYRSDADRERDICASLLIACKEGHVQVVKLLLEHNADVSHTDTDGHTALHIASKKGHSQVVKVLLDHDRASFINHTDTSKRTPLYIACEEGHVQVVKVLLEYDADVTEADQDGLNPLDIAVEEGHRGAALAIVNSDQWEFALRNYIYKSKRGGVRKWCPCSRRRIDSTGSETLIVTPMRRIIMKLPDVARAVFDRCCVNKLSPDDPDFEITCNYEFLEDFDLYDNYPFFKWPPQSQYSSQNHCLHILANSPSSDLLKHPLASTLLDRKWNKYGRIVYYTNLIFYLIFVILLTSFALTVPSPNSTLCMEEVLGNESSTFIDCSKDHFVSQIYLSIASVFVIVYSAVMLIRELVQVIQFGAQYLTSFVNYIEVSLFIFTIMFASVHSSQCYCTHSWQWQVGVIAVFLSWIALIFAIRNAPVVGIYVVMFIKIFNNFMKVVILALLLVIAFAFPFYMMFYDPHDQSKGIRTPFITPWRTLLKTIIMTMGEYDIDVLLLQDNEVNSADVQYPVVTFSLLVVFVVLMPILFLNLLTSLAVGDTQEIQKSADTYRLILKVEFILPMEEFLRSLLRNALRILKKIHAPNVVEDFLEKLRQNLIIIGHEQKIYPNKPSVWKKFIGSLLEKRLVTEPLATVADVKHQIKPLSEEVKGLQSSVDQLLSIVKSMRNERRGGRERGRDGASEGAGNERERNDGEEQKEVPVSS